MMSRRLSVLIALALALVIASPAAALTLKREWRAGMGSGGSHGRITLRAWTIGNGSLDLALTGMRRSTTYRIVVRRGTCRKPGTRVVKLGRVSSDAGGAITVKRGVSTYRMGKIWAQRERSLNIVVASGSSVQCGNLGFTHATRIAIPAYDIRLPVVKGPSGYPYCNVAMYLAALYQPTEPGITYIYAHARKGMFLPLLNASKINDGAKMIGKTVYLWTSNSVRYTYRIVKVRRHVRSIQSALSATSERLWLQTSEGPNSSYPKLIVVARRVDSTPVSYAAAHPKARPVRC
jgi:sortase (surface protein transpeptidase)